MIKISAKTLVDLEFPRIREKLGTYCQTEMGLTKSQKLEPFPTPGETLFSLHQVKEYQSSFMQDAQIPSHGFEPVHKEIELLDIQNSVLELQSFQKIAALSSTANAQVKFFKLYQELYPCLHKTSENVEITEEIVSNVHRVINRFGEIKTEASPLLSQLRKSILQVQEKIDTSFSADLSRYSSQGYLDEIRESVIENKRVLAVTAMYKKRIRGMVLGHSKTGSIVFIQPENTLTYSRELNTLEYEEKQEINRILKELTDRIRPFSTLLSDYQELLSDIDLVSAKVKLAEVLQAVLPKITRKRELDLRQAYHPLLLLNNNRAGKKTFPQDIHLHPQNRIIVISGPNAGGKSITLKTIGLLQVMLQSGLFVPVHPYSRMCFFNSILSDIGDNQSIENHLSTYSYRLKNMQYFLKKCDQNTLFLIDEFGTGSDPELGGALAETFLEVFYERESFGVITTHYANLKKMANETEGISNANMHFDSKRMEPEFKLQMGEAGSSFTFEVAAKNGIPYRLINRSKKKVERGKIRFDRSIAKLQQQRSELAKTTKELRQEKIKTTEHKELLDDKSQRVQQKLEDFQELYDSNQQLIHLGRKLDKLCAAYFHNPNKKQLVTEILKIVGIENAKRDQKNKAAQQKEKQRLQSVFKEAEKKIEKIRKEKKKKELKERAEKKEQEKKKLASYAPGDRVRIEGGAAVGTLERIKKGKALINYGSFTTEVILEQIELVQKAKKGE